MAEYQRDIDIDNLWPTIRLEAESVVKTCPLLTDFYQQNILQHSSYDQALSYVLAEKLADNSKNIAQWQQFIHQLINKNTTISQATIKDLLCQLQSNASIKDHYTPLLYFVGYQALQCYRLAHYCWLNNQLAMANYIQGRMVSLFGVDIHPGAVIGEGIFMDHAVGIVIGETAVIENGVTLFQGVTLGGTGKESGDRHPKVRQGAFIGAGAMVLGNIEIGKNAKVGSGAIVVKAVPPETTVVGPVAKLLSR
ncbi:serine acetyltransferase [Candidatus Endobugula sertula]|uniref:Serine acetyltransferase n=1 Tax=Candidatus Endobugula sertula TaxID=62101 RepID=A0A1D2QSB9_9GAMM|nr:serine acetyltransferase [Candidatus Endobugula sertula]